jgi:hypothetical protein
MKLTQFVFVQQLLSSLTSYCTIPVKISLPQYEKHITKTHALIIILLSIINCQLPRLGKQGKLYLKETRAIHVTGRGDS